MALYSQHNLYHGVNAHLHSLLQSEAGGWESFHTDYITALRMALDIHLPAGYLARSEKSLQISAFNPLTGYAGGRWTEPDLTVFQTRPTAQLPPDEAVTAPTLTMPLLETLEEEAYLSGIMIYQVQADQVLGRPVTRIELLSPGNKPPGSHHRQYVQKRQETLESKLRLVEIDLLHESKPALRGIASYPDREQGSFPYTLIVNDPRPSLEEGTTAVYGFQVDEPQPTILIPLAGEDRISFAFNRVYNAMFAGSRFCGAVVDYSQPPINIDRYAAADRQRIRQCMERARLSAPGGESENSL